MSLRRVQRASVWSVLLVLGVVLGGCATSSKPVVADDAFGVLVMAHGGSQQWNDRVLAAVAPLRERYKIDVAFGMADAASLQNSVGRLEAQGVRRIAVVRLFVSGESWYERTQQILGLAPGAPERPQSAGDDHAEHAGHSMQFWRITTHSTFVLSREGLADAPEIDAILMERTQQLSRDPASEDVLILAHGPGSDEENARWIRKISTRATAVSAARPFRRLGVYTLREDWPEKREVAEREVREFVQRAVTEHGRAIVVPFRLEGFGPYASVLDGLDYASDGVGLLPHPNVTQWIERQIVELRG